MNDYERVARVIRYLDAAHEEQPDLGTLAKQAGLSASRLHHLFSSWAGITPKDFLQCLTVAHAKALLRTGESVMGAALGSGLSGPSRLHDLCVSLEAATPGELKAGGTGWTFDVGFAESPFGRSFIAESPRGICHLAFVDAQPDRTILAAFQAEWPNGRLQRDDRRAAKIARRIFDPRAGSAVQPKLRALVRGTAFQVRVWRALVQVERGTVVSYGQLARAVGKPSAARAVGSAVGRNDLAFLIPCHRVIRETGVLGDYRWGAVRKRALLVWESSVPG